MEQQTSSLRVFKPKPVRASAGNSPIQSLILTKECNPFSLPDNSDVLLPKFKKSLSSNKTSSTSIPLGSLGELERLEDDELKVRVQIEREMMTRRLLAFPRPSNAPVRDLSSSHPYEDQVRFLPIVKLKPCCCNKKVVIALERPSNPMVKDGLWAEQSETSTDEDRE